MVEREGEAVVAGSGRPCVVHVLHGAIHVLAVEEELVGGGGGRGEGAEISKEAPPQTARTICVLLLASICVWVWPRTTVPAYL